MHVLFKLSLTLLMAATVSCNAVNDKKPFQEVDFKAADGLEVSADLYMTNNPAAPFIILFHQAGWSRGEYRETAPRLNQMGFNCLAVDQRSGGEVNGVVNQTHSRAEAKELATTYVDAYADLQAALQYVTKTHKPETLIVWGSSYSSALGLKLTSENPGVVDGVLAFSPGEYFKKLGQPEDYITSSAQHIQCPAFITSAKDEQPVWQGIYDAIPVKSKKSFVPQTEGNHGARALWPKFDDSQAYWKAVSAFLSQFQKK